MTQFERLVDKTYVLLSEQPVAPQPPPLPPGAASSTPSALPGVPGSEEIPGLPDISAGAPEAQPPGVGDDAAKQDADPIAYTENMLAKLVDIEEGVTPEMFAEFLNTFNIADTKIQDKEGFARFYKDFHTRLTYVIETKKQLEQMFTVLQTTLKDVLGKKELEPDTAKGGVGKQGPSGPGVR